MDLLSLCARGLLSQAEKGSQNISTVDRIEVDSALSADQEAPSLHLEIGYHDDITESIEFFSELLRSLGAATCLGVVTPEA